MRQVVFLPVIILFLLQSGGILFIYTLRLENHKSSMTNLLHKENPAVQKIVLSRDDFNANNIGFGEIFINGKMYDAKVISSNEDQLELIALCDDDEEKIFDKIKRIFDPTFPLNTNLPEQLSKFFNQIYSTSDHCLTNFDLYSSYCFFKDEQNNLASIFFEKSTPPPEFRS